METRNVELETVSIELYRYMCNVLVGSEKIVRYRRLFYKLFDDTFNKSLEIETISSGSKSEGLDLPGSDFDVMILLKKFKVFECADNMHDIGCTLTLDTNNAHSGFALLKFPESVASLFSEFFTKTDNGYFLSSCKWKDFYKVKPRLFGELSSIHGPSIYAGGRDVDLVSCLQCFTWPIAAKHWLLRNRSSRWPSQELMENITELGVLLVPHCNGDPQCRRAKRSHNKCTYIRYRLILSRLLINTYSDAASGWLLLAAFFYNHQEYYKMFPLLDLVTAVLSIDRFCLSIYEKANFVHTINRKRLSASCSFLKRLRQEVMKDVPYIHDTKKSFLDHKNLAFTEIGASLPCYSSIMLHYFSFLAHHELGNNSQAEFQLRMLQRTVYQTVYGSPHSCVNAYYYLRKALIVFKDLVGLYMTSKIFVEIMKQSQEYKTFLEDVSSFNDATALLARTKQEIYG
ncbi:unnamed protein product [Mytilus coruscus]|uniref:Mab-21-like HhH/H2TH-like domain-containing protein n=1 Tax=Mytilus coruscus TaxID=42192 RepID=A0A6J8DUB3_MYTCO|nr:unnamed protein product [Mytilus coruscus]